jgi:hypothetical protein
MEKIAIMRSFIIFILSDIIKMMKVKEKDLGGGGTARMGR